MNIYHVKCWTCKLNHEGGGRHSVQSPDFAKALAKTHQERFEAPHDIDLWETVDYQNGFKPTEGWK